MGAELPSICLKQIPQPRSRSGNVTVGGTVIAGVIETMTSETADGIVTVGGIVIAEGIEVVRAAADARADPPVQGVVEVVESV